MLIRLVREYLPRYKRLLWLLVALQAVQALCTLYLPTLNAEIINRGVLTGNKHYIWTHGALMLGVTLVQVMFAVSAMFCGARIAMGFGRDLRRDLFHNVIDFSAKEVAQFGAPSLITRITNDVQQVQLVIVMACTLLVVAPITVIFGVFFAIREDGPLSLMLLVSIPALALGVGIIAMRMHPQFLRMQERVDRVNQILREQISGIRVVRAFVREPEEGRRFAKANDDLTDTALRAGRLQAYMFPTVMLAINLSSAAAVWFGAHRINAHHMQVGSLVAFLGYLLQILMAVLMGTFVLTLAPRASVSAERIADVLDTTSSVVDSDDPVREFQGRPSLELRNAGFTFPGAEKPVVANVSFNVEAGETLAIMGSTGSGKTSLLNLIARLVDVTEGEVLLNGVNVRDIDRDVLRRAVGFVPQKPFLFSGTVATNVRFGDPDASDEAVWHALEIAQARDFVDSMPGRLDARIAQGGTNVSGGQRQRLAIARAIAHRPDVYLFDDSFSALDLKTDARLRAALGPVTEDAVNVIVAQRVSTVLNADKILVLDEGRPVGLGSHHELLETCPTYAEIVESQFVNEDIA